MERTDTAPQPPEGSNLPKSFHCAFCEVWHSIEVFGCKYSLQGNGLAVCNHGRVMEEAEVRLEDDETVLSQLIEKYGTDYKLEPFDLTLKNFSI